MTVVNFGSITGPAERQAVLNFTVTKRPEKGFTQYVRYCTRIFRCDNHIIFMALTIFTISFAN